MLGVVRVYSKKSTIILSNVNAVVEDLKRYSRNQDAVRRGAKRKRRGTVSGDNTNVSLAAEDDVARFESITLPVQKRSRSKSRTYALPALSSGRSKESRLPDSFGNPNFDHSGANMDMDVLQAMETVFPSIPVPQLGEHLSSRHTSRNTSDRQRLLMYEARDQDITLAAPMANLDNMEYAMFDEDLPVSIHSDPSADLGNRSGSDWLNNDLGIQAGAALDFHPSSGGRSRSRTASEISRDATPKSSVINRNNSISFAVAERQRREDVAPPIAEEGYDMAGPPPITEEQISSPQGQPLRAPITGSKRRNEADHAVVARSAVKKKRAKRLVMDDVTELSPGHIRSCLRDTSDLVQTDSRTTRKKGRRSSVNAMLCMPHYISLFPKQIGSLWNDVVGSKIFADGGGKVQVVERNRQVSEDRNGSIGQSKSSSGQRNSGDLSLVPDMAPPPQMDIPYDAEEYPDIPVEFEVARGAADGRRSLEVLRDGDANVGAAAEVMSLPSKSDGSKVGSLFNDSGRGPSDASIENVRDGIFEMVCIHERTLFVVYMRVM